MQVNYTNAASPSPTHLDAPPEIYHLRYGNLGNDMIYGALGAATIFGGQGHDTLIAGEAANQQFGNAGDVYFKVFGAIDGAALFNGGAGDDTLDLFIGNSASVIDSISQMEQVNLLWNGGAGMASLVLNQSSDIVVDANTLQAGQRLFIDAGALGGKLVATGGRGNDFFVGSKSDDMING